MSKLLCKASHSRKEQSSEAFVGVPFVWEEKPGQPKRNFIVDIPRQAISIPFQWEERPGKPKSSPKQLDSVLFCSPITSIREGKTEGRDDNDEEEEDSDGNEEDDNPKEDSDGNEEDGDPKEDKRLYEEEEEKEDCEEYDDDRDEDEELFELDLESFAFDENHLPVNSFSAYTQSLLIAHCMSSLSEMSCSTPMPPDGTEEEEEEEEESRSSGSEHGEVASDSEDDSSSYIEFIFPLNSPQESGFLEKVFAMDNRISVSSGHSSFARPSCCRVKCVKMKSMPPNLSHLMFTIRMPKLKSGAHKTTNSIGVQEKNHAVVRGKKCAYSLLLSKKKIVCCPLGAERGTPRKKNKVRLDWWRKKGKHQNLSSKQQWWKKRPTKQSWWRKRPHKSK